MEDGDILVFVIWSSLSPSRQRSPRLLSVMAAWYVSGEECSVTQCLWDDAHLMDQNLQYHIDPTTSNTAATA